MNRFPGQGTVPPTIWGPVPAVPDPFPEKPLQDKGRSRRSRPVPNPVPPVPCSPPKGGTGNRNGNGDRTHPCRKCSQPVITGLDAPRAGFLVTVDPCPLSLVGEVQALTDGRRTYDLVAGKIRRRLDWHIRAMPASTRHPTLAEHRCGQPLPDAWLAPTVPATPPRDTLEVPF